MEYRNGARGHRFHLFSPRCWDGPVDTPDNNDDSRDDGNDDCWLVKGGDKKVQISEGKGAIAYGRRQ